MLDLLYPDRKPSYWEKKAPVTDKKSYERQY